jgi:hypothetical protein
MFKLLLVAIALVMGYVFLQQIPEIQRYLRLRSM